MYISQIKLHNFKGFNDDRTINFDTGINFLVGDNNCGKSTVFEAIDFIRAKKTRDEVITKTKLESDDFVSVEIELKGDDLEKLVGTDALKKYKPYLIDTDGSKSLRIMRSSEESKYRTPSTKKRFGGKVKNKAKGFLVGTTTARAVEVLALRPGGRADALRTLITRENTQSSL